MILYVTYIFVFIITLISYFLKTIKKCLNGHFQDGLVVAVVLQHHTLLDGKPAIHQGPLKDGEHEINIQNH